MSVFEAITAQDHFFVANPHHYDVFSNGPVDMLDFASEVSATATTYEWLTSSGHRIVARGVFTYSGGVVSGTVEDVAIYLDNVGVGDILVNDLSGVTIASLLSGHAAFWQTLFSGDDTFSTSSFGSSSISGDGFTGVDGAAGGNDDFGVFEGNVYTSAAGDYSEIAVGATVSGGADTFNVNGNNVGGAHLQGDARVVPVTSTLYGGDDAFFGLVNGGTIIGDAHFTLGVLYGGSDEISVNSNDAEGQVIGDAYVVGGPELGGVAGTLYGGADIISGNTDYVSGEAHQFYLGTFVGGDDIITNSRSTTEFIGGLYGDVRYIEAEATADSRFVGGDDLITYTGPYSSKIVGDIGQLLAGALITDITLGNDILRGSNSSGVGPGGIIYRDTIYGDYDWDQVGVLTTAKGGHDWIDGGDGDDRLYGQTGIDTVAFEFATHTVTVDLNLQGAAQATGGGFNDLLEGFENIFGSAQADTLRGDAGNNVIEGAVGGDTLGGRGGYDTLSYSRSNAAVTISLLANTASGGHATGDVISGFENILGSVHVDTLTGSNAANIIEGGLGGDTMTGNGGLDTLSYLFSDAAVTVNLLNNTASGGHATGDVFSGFEYALGSAFDDTLTGSNGINILTGGGGGDTLYGNGGLDVLNGGDGDDTLDGGSGVDFLNGGEGNDRVIYSIATTGASFNFQSQTYQGSVNETWSDIESATGTQGDDNFTPSLAANHMDGQGGSDSVAYNDSNAGVMIDLDGVTLGIGGHAEGDTLTGIEKVIGSAFDDTLTGHAGDDRLEGRNGVDTLTGELGADTLIGGSGGDILDGGSGVDDVASYTSSQSGVTVGVNSGAVNSGGDATGDTLLGIEHITGSAFNDVITGNSAQNTLTGGDGDDALNASTNNDEVYGGGGDDILLGGNGADIIDGGTETLLGDTASYASSAARIIADLSTNFADGSGQGAGDTFIDIENLEGSNFNDILTGDANNNTLSGLGGNDEINGGGGDDILNGASGIDELNGGLGNDTYTAGPDGDFYVFTDAAFGQDRIIGFQNGQDLLDFTALGFSHADFNEVVVGADLVLELIADPLQTVTLVGINPNTIDQLDFV